MCPEVSAICLTLKQVSKGFFVEGGGLDGSKGSREYSRAGHRCHRSPLPLELPRVYRYTMTNDDDVRGLSLSLPATTERPSYGRPAFRVKDKVFACLYKEPGVLVLWRGSEEEKQELIAADPGKFFTTPHYDGYPMVLVRLAAVDRDELAELLEEAWLTRAPASLRADRDGS